MTSRTATVVDSSVGSRSVVRVSHTPALFTRNCSNLPSTLLCLFQSAVHATWCLVSALLYCVESAVHR